MTVLGGVGGGSGENLKVNNNELTFKDLQSALICGTETSISMMTPPIPFYVPFWWVWRKRVQRQANMAWIESKAGRGDHSKKIVCLPTGPAQSTFSDIA